MAESVVPPAEKARRIGRTVLQFIIAFSVVAPTIPLLVDAVTKDMPKDSQVAITIAAVGAFFVAVGAAVTRVMLIPQVNEWLAKIGLGATTTTTDETADQTDAEGEPTTGEEFVDSNDAADPFEGVMAAIKGGQNGN